MKWFLISGKIPIFWGMAWTLLLKKNTGSSSQFLWWILSFTEVRGADVSWVHFSGLQVVTGRRKNWWLKQLRDSASFVSRKWRKNRAAEGALTLAAFDSRTGFRHRLPCVPLPGLAKGSSVRWKGWQQAVRTANRFSGQALWTTWVSSGGLGSGWDRDFS